jgi:hypothetical protein
MKAQKQTLGILIKFSTSDENIRTQDMKCPMRAGQIPLVLSRFRRFASDYAARTRETQLVITDAAAGGRDITPRFGETLRSVARPIDLIALRTKRARPKRRKAATGAYRSGLA